MSRKSKMSRPSGASHTSRGSQDSRPRHMPAINDFPQDSPMQTLEHQAFFSQPNYCLSSNPSRHEPQGITQVPQWIDSRRGNGRNDDQDKWSRQPAHGLLVPNSTASMAGSTLSRENPDWDTATSAAMLYQQSLMTLPRDYDQTSEYGSSGDSPEAAYASLNNGSYTSAQLAPYHQFPSHSCDVNNPMSENAFQLGDFEDGTSFLPDAVLPSYYNTSGLQPQQWIPNVHDCGPVGVSQQLPSPPESCSGSPPYQMSFPTMQGPEAIPNDGHFFLPSSGYGTSAYETSMSQPVRRLDIHSHYLQNVLTHEQSNAEKISNSAPRPIRSASERKHSQDNADTQCTLAGSKTSETIPPRNHALYKANADKDGYYHCPFAKKVQCSHPKAKQKCTYE